MIHLVLLSGGSGTRLWPLSNDARSKQFLKVLRDTDGNHVSMVQRVFSQIEKIQAETDVTIATSAAQQSSIESQIESGYELVLEPERRDTAPAVMLACAHLALKQQVNLDDTVVVMPIDTYADQVYYDRVADLDSAVQNDAAELVLMGVEPTYPSEKYGYIVPTMRQGIAWPVERFKEKPCKSEAESLVAAGALWNCGVFAFKLGFLVNTLNAYVNGDDFDAIAAQYSKLPKTSFDYEVVEKASFVAVVPYSGAWSDLGTWNTLTEKMAEEHAGRVVVDSDTCKNVHVVNETGLPMVVAGLSDAVVVATPDGILVANKEASAHLKPLVAQVATSRPMYERRRWGEYRVLDFSIYPDGKKSLVKELVIEPGKQLSYQRHSSRSEVWTIVSGEGEIVLDREVFSVGPGLVISIEPGRMHSVRACSELRVVEVQMGDVLIEEDIERFGNWWGDLERKGLS